MLRFLGQLYTYVRPYRMRLAAGLFFGLLFAASTALFMAAVSFVPKVVFAAPGENPLQAELAKLPTWTPQALRAWIEGWLPGFTAPVPRGPLLVVVAILPAVALFRVVCGHLNHYLMNWVGIHAVTDLRTRLFAHLQRLSLEFSNRARTGELISRVANDCTALLTVIAESFAVLVRDPITILTLAGWLLWRYPRLTAVALFVFPVCALPIIIYTRKIRQSVRQTRELSAKLTQIMAEAFTAQRVVKAYNLEDRLAGDFGGTARDIARQMMRGVRAKDASGQIIEFLGAVGISMVFAWVALGREPGMQLADFIAFFGSMVLIYPGFKAVTRLHGQLEQGRAASEHVFALLAQESTIRDPVSPKPLRAAGAPIVFEEVSFEYEPGKRVLQDFQLRIEPGQFIALVGGSGSGKTTVTNLLLRFYDPVAGSVRIGDLDIRETGQHALREQIAVVTQEVLLFHDTIRANIRLGRPDASDAAVEAAARHAHAHEFILARPDGYETVVGDKGALLSGGQKQRLAIARALLKDAPILVLDEATSALDSESERLVQAALEELMKGRTTICIAHRLSTVQNADRIVVMDQGRIVETGRHEELLRRGGPYARLHALQFAP